MPRQQVQNERQAHVRWDGEALAVGKGEEFAVVKHGIEVLHPIRIDVAVEDDPLPLAALSTNVVDDFAQSVREQSVAPLASVRVETSVQRLLRDRLGVDDVRNTLDAFDALERLEEDSPCATLARTTRSNHHETVVDL